MQVADNTVVSFHYNLSDARGEAIESSRDKEPMAYLHGAGNIIPGLEQAMVGHEAGDEFEVTVPPAEAYGERSEDNIQRVPIKHLEGAGQLKPGQRLMLQTQQGPVQVTVAKVGRFNVDLDTNHPLAGETLTFAVEITDVRAATETEVKHGHVHDGDDHHHEQESDGD